MRLSVIIPVHNAEKCALDRCIASIGVHEGVEIVIVDDGSKVPAETHAEGARVVRQENRGAYLARKRGTEEAKGEYVWYVDQDDEVLLVPEIPDADMVRFRQNYGWMCIGDKIYRRELALKAFAELGDLRLKNCEDGLFYLAARKHAGKIADVDVDVYRYMDTPGSATHRFNPDIVEERERFVDEYMRLCPDGDRAKLSKESAVYIACALCRWEATRKEIGEVCRRLVESRLARDGEEEIVKDKYARKMMFAVKHPWVIGAYRLARRLCRRRK